MCDRNGIIEGAIPGIANAAVVTLEECRQAIAILLAPDPDSRTKEFEGRRLEEIDGGWRILNHQKHKDKLGFSSEANRVRVAKCRARKAAKDVTPGNASNIQSNDLDPRSLDLNQPIPPTPKGDVFVVCPADLDLTPEQIGILETSLIPSWAIPMMRTDLVGKWVTRKSADKTLDQWRSYLYAAMLRQWRSDKRPHKPAPEASIDEQPKGGKPGEVWHKDGYWYRP
jgi:hypothetical protein